MAKFLHWSDLHLEFRDFEIPSPEDLPAKPDAILLGGDTATKGEHLFCAAVLHDRFDCPVLLVEGNHEFYGQHYETFLAESDDRLSQLRASGRDIEILRGTARLIKDTRVIGATLWTDFAQNTHWHETAKSLARRRMVDYRKIHTGSDPRRLTPEDTVVFHHIERDRITGLLSQPFDGDTIVMTHHVPGLELVHPDFQGDALTPAFATDMMAEVLDLPFSTWIYGHSHLGRDISTGGETPHDFISNMRGYPGEVTTFDPLRMLFTGADAPVDTAM